MADSTVVLYPFPAMGHLVSMVELAKLITTHQPSLSVLLLIPPSPLENDSIDNLIAATPSITFRRFPTIPLPPNSPSSFMDLAFEIPKLYNPALRNILVPIKQTVAAVVLDFFSNAAFEVATGLGLPTYYFYTSGASGLCEFLYLRTIHETTSGSIKDLDGYFNIPGVPPIHASDMPSVVSDRESGTYKNFVKTAFNMAKSSGIIANGFAGLEERAVNALKNGECVPDGPTPPVYMVGPLIANGDQTNHECFKWLKLQPKKSVVFLCFGSMGLFGKEQLTEMAIGLEKSGQRFLWVVRDPAPDGDFDGLFPEGFTDRVGGRGLVVKNWAPQPAILSHDSVGGFVSHCGWNSVLEAVVAGVPMVAWPLYAEQKMNRVFLVEEIKVALAVETSEDGFVTAEALAEKVRGVMEGEDGRVVRERVFEMSGKAKVAVEADGLSRVEFSRLIRSWTPRLFIDT